MIQSPAHGKSPAMAHAARALLSLQNMERKINLPKRYNREEENLSDEDNASTEPRHTNTILSNQEMVPIGKGNAMVPARLFNKISWKSYTKATCKLLTAVFPRSILATHTLSGKTSAKFTEKKKLDRALVNDIIMTVVEKCGVSENVVKTRINVKCADESTMLRSRLKMAKSQSETDVENVTMPQRIN